MKSRRWFNQPVLMLVLPHVDRESLLYYYPFTEIGDISDKGGNKPLTNTVIQEDCYD